MRPPIVAVGLWVAAAVLLAGVVAVRALQPADPAPHRYAVSQLTVPGGPTGYVYCAVVVSDAGALTTLFCEPVGTADAIPASPQRVPGTPSPVQ